MGNGATRAFKVPIKYVFIIVIRPYYLNFILFLLIIVDYSCYVESTIIQCLFNAVCLLGLL